MRALSSTAAGAALAALALAAPVAAQQQRTAQATLLDESGERVGEVLLTETANRGVLLQVRLDGAPEGRHAFHIHETGACEPTFEAAGGHFSPEGSEHGFLSPHGAHAGDLTNLSIPSDGETDEARLAPGVTL
ncbi:MAG TPA: superoxide dismutase family protein, partial [Longimicrobiales bacterium]|nr:superoxide dismutase family protein [Longimicrobiales bacterium]